VPDFTKTAKDVIDYIKKNDVKIVDVRFTDLPGLMQHFSIPAGDVTEQFFAEGIPFDGSSIRGFQQIQESDMLLMPDPTTAYLDPFRTTTTLNLMCFVKDPATGEDYSRDPRNIARKAEANLKASGIAELSYWGPEAEFFIFDEARFDQTANSGYYFLDSTEAAWGSGDEGNRGYRIRHKEGYFPVPPMDQYQDLRTDMLLNLQKVGITVEVQHHEVATAGQAEIDIRYDTLLRCADNLMTFKYVIKNTAWHAGKTVTFMPKPLFGDNGSGMHCHQSLWENGSNLFFDETGYAGLSDTARYYIGGLLKHAPSLLAFTNPTTNSYRRLVPGYEAPIYLLYSQRNRSAAVRIPLAGKSEAAKRIEFRTPDPSCNPYLAFAAMLQAGLDGVRNKIEPPAVIDKDLYDLEPEEKKGLPSVPGSLEAVLDTLEADHEYLLEGDVFTPDVIETWLDFKRSHELDAVRLRPHPHEFSLYFDI
jgi:glutamine synthetase